MTESSDQLAGAPNRFPLSCAQELWCLGDQGDNAGTFGPRFISTKALRIAGRIDVAALQGALNDVVGRHEILRTVVVRDAEPPYQQVHPPGPAPLQVRDLPSTSDLARDVIAEQLILQTEQGTMSVRKLPLLRAVLGRFDDRDSVLILVTHHSASDGWSLQLITRDLAAFYKARTTGRPAELPGVRQYREYAAWQPTVVAGPAAVQAHEYWRAKLRGARIFTLPTDRPIPELHTRGDAGHNFAIDPEVAAAASAFAKGMRSSMFMVLLAAFSVLAHQITGTSAPVIQALTTGRNEPQFQDTVGPFLNFLPLRTDIGDCATFREIVTRVRETCVEAYSHEIPIQHIERAAPELMQSLEEARMSEFIFGMFQPQFDDAAVRMADGSYEIRKRVLPDPETSEMPGGLAWNMDLLPSGELTGSVQFNPEEFDERTVVDWVSGYQRILSRLTEKPDLEWQAL
jgi:hypothetical protein